MYNKYFLKAGDEAVDTNSMVIWDSTIIPCKVKGIIDNGEGKFP